jgi:hypothetical protein
MAGGSSLNTYIDCFQYVRAPTGHDTTTLVGNLSRLSSATSVGATSIPLQIPTTVLLNAYDNVTIFDGSSSEIAVVSTMTPQGATSIPVQALQYAHITGTPLCSDGSQGSLAAMIIDASAQIEEYCRQSLLQATYSNETLPLRTTRAAVTRDYRLLFRPKHFPVTNVSAITALLSDGVTLSLSTSYAQLDADAQLVTMTQLSTTAQSQTTFWGNVSPPMYPTTPGFLQISYTAGYTAASMPPSIRQACIWMTSDLLSDRQNPTGAAEIQLGQMHLVTRLRGETTGRSVLVMRAEKALDAYKQKPF